MGSNKKILLAPPKTKPKPTLINAPVEEVAHDSKHERKLANHHVAVAQLLLPLLRHSFDGCGAGVVSNAVNNTFTAAFASANATLAAILVVVVFVATAAAAVTI
jgi:hypothetical protein